MKYFLYLIILTVILNSCKKGPCTAYSYNDETDEMILDTIPCNDLRDFPQIQKNKNIDSLIIRIIKTDCVYERHIGLGGNYSEQYARFERLMEILTNKEMFELTKHYNPIVRAYAFKALKIDNSRYMEMAKNELENDTTRICTMGGCIMSTEKISEFINRKY